MKRHLLVACAAAGLVIAGCGGGKSGTPAHSSQTQAQTGQATFNVLVPKAVTGSSSARKPAYISPSTQSVSFQVPSMASPTVITLTVSSGNCSTVETGLQCSATFTAPVGAAQLMTIKTYATTGGTGTPLSMNTVSVDVASGTNSTVNVTLNGVAKTISLLLNPGAVPVGTSATISAIANLVDAAGNTIIGAGTPTDSNGATLATPTLTSSDTTDFSVGAFSNGTFSVSYNGAAASPTTFTLALAGFTSATATLVVGTAANSGPIVITATGASQELGAMGPVTQGGITFSAPTDGGGETITFAATATAPAVTPTTPPLNASDTGLWYFAFSTDIGTSFNASPGVSLTLSSITPGTYYYLAYYDSDTGAWIEPYQGPATVNGNTLTFAPAARALSLDEDTNFVLALYATTTLATPTPTPSPTPVPTATPSPTGTSTPVGSATAFPTPGATPNLTESCDTSSQRCGVERWHTKTLDDVNENLINWVPQLVTVTQLNNFPVPNGYNEYGPGGVDNGRYAPYEDEVFTVQAVLVTRKHETGSSGDDDYHIEISDPNNPAATMVTEAPHGECTYACASGFGGDFDAIRNELDACFGAASSSFQAFPAGVVVNLTGVGFFDGLHGQTGALANPNPSNATASNMELHPLVYMEFVSGKPVGVPGC